MAEELARTKASTMTLFMVILAPLRSSACEVRMSEPVVRRSERIPNEIRLVEIAAVARRRLFVRDVGGVAVGKNHVATVLVAVGEPRPIRLGAVECLIVVRIAGRYFVLHRAHFQHAHRRGWV